MAATAKRAPKKKTTAPKRAKQTTAKPAKKPAKPKPEKQPRYDPTASTIDQDGLLAAIFADPDDDRARVVYSDALQDLGDPRGDFIALQLAGKETEAKALLDKHRKAWQDFGAKGARYTWERGFIDRLTVDAAALIAAGSRIFELHPVRDLRIHKNGPKAPLHKILAYPLRCVTHFYATEAMTSDDLVAFAEATTMGNLVDLDLGYTRPGANAKRLAASTAYPKLTHVHFGSAALDDKDLATLVAGSFLANVVSLGLAANRIGAKGVAALAAAPWTAKLRGLNLSRNELTDDGVVALAQSPHLTGLETLDLAGYFGSGGTPPYGTVAAEALAVAATTTFAKLKTLDMSWALTPDAARIVRAAFGDRLVMRTERFE